MASNTFRELEETNFFVTHVGEYLSLAPAELTPVLSCEITVDPARLAFAHNEYVQNVQRFSLYLQSGDPDHYKRAGALLHALYMSQPIVDVCFQPKLEDVDTLITEPGVNYGDAENALTFGHFYDDYHNEFAAFGLAFDTCRQYEQEPRSLASFDYIHTVCTYMKNNGNLSVESMYMVLKSLML